MDRNAEIAALQREGRQYVAAGMIDRARLVNDELALRGAELVAVPKAPPTAAPQKRTSTQAATRQKRSS